MVQCGLKHRTLAGQAEEEEFAKGPEQEHGRGHQRVVGPQRAREEGRSKVSHAAEKRRKVREKCSPSGKAQTS